MDPNRHDAAQPLEIWDIERLFSKFNEILVENGIAQERLNEITGDLSDIKHRLRFKIHDPGAYVAEKIATAGMKRDHVAKLLGYKHASSFAKKFTKPSAKDDKPFTKKDIICLEFLFGEDDLLWLVCDYVPDDRERKARIIRAAAYEQLQSLVTE